MAGELSNIQQLCFDIEGAFNTRNGLPSWLNIQAMDIEYQPREEALEDSTFKAQRGSNPPILGSQAGGEFSGKIYLCGLQTGAGDATPAVATVHGPVWRTAMGAQTLTEGTTITGGTVSVPVVTRQTGNAIVSGTIAGFVTNDGVMHPRLVLSVADSSGDDALTLDRALPSMPDNGNLVYGSATYAWSGNGPAETFQAQAVTQTTDSDQEFYGCVCNSWTVEQLAPRTLPMAAFSWLMASFTDDPSIIGAVQPAAATPLQKSVWKGSEVSIWPYSETTVAYSSGHLRCLRSFTAAHQLDARIAPCPHAEEGISGWEFGDGSLADIEWTVGRTDDWRDSWITGASSTPSYFGQMICFGKNPGRTVVLYYRRTHITETPGFANDNGIMTTTIKSAVSSDYSSGLPPMLIALL